MAYPVKGASKDNTKSKMAKMGLSSAGYDQHKKNLYASAKEGSKASVMSKEAARNPMAVTAKKSRG